MDLGTVQRTCAIVESLVRGAIHDRHTIKAAFGMNVAAADKYIRAVSNIPGVILLKQGKRLTVRWSFTDAIRGAGI